MINEFLFYYSVLYIFVLKCQHLKNQTNNKRKTVNKKFIYYNIYINFMIDYNLLSRFTIFSDVYIILTVGSHIMSQGLE